MGMQDKSQIVELAHSMVAEDRKQAPDAQLVDEYYQDDSQRIVANAEKALGAKAKGMRFVYLDTRREPSYWKSLGYEFVQVDGKQVFHKGDPLAMIAETVPARRERQAAAVARAQLKKELDGDGATGVRDRNGKLHKPRKAVE